MTLFDTRALFETFTANTTGVHDGVRVVPLALTSRHQALLVDEDQALAENATFTAPLLLPEAGAPFRELTILFHGLNEGTEAKLFPWAANLAARGMPALIFPSSFHLARRPPSFLAARGEAFAARKLVEGNARVSPYNAMLSHRMATRPDRFLRGTLQTYRDVIDLARSLDRGDSPALTTWFQPRTRVSFLGYSIGGYLAQLAMLANEDGLFSDSRALLFSTGAALAQVRPQTILILDTHAQDQLVATYDTAEAREGRLALFDDVGAFASERKWLLSMLYADATYREGLRALGARVRAIANVRDLVFPIDAVRDALDGVGRDELELGLHELPFNQSAPLGEVYTDREGRRLLLTVVKSHTVADDLRDGFAKFVDLAHGHLAP
jgi:hypothetical protein